SSISRNGSQRDTLNGSLGMMFMAAPPNDGQRVNAQQPRKFRRARSPRMAALEVRGGGFSRGLGVLWRDVFGRRTREHLLTRLELGDSRRAVRPRVDADFLPGNERLIRGLHDRELLDAAFDIDEDFVRLLLRRGSFDLLADDRACDTGNRTCDIRSAAAAHGMP